MQVQKKLDYKWVIIVLCFLMVLISLGFANSTKSLFPDEIAKALGTERSPVSVGESLRYISTAIVNIFFGAMIVKFGPKKLILAGFACLISAMILYSVAENLWLIYPAGILLGIGFSWTTTTMIGYVVGVWCSENKGTIMGLILASSGLGGAIAIPIVGGLIDPETVGSYRAAYRLIAIVLSVAAVLILLFFKDKPKNVATLPPQGAKTKKRGADWVGIPFREALRKPYFWGAVICIFLTGMILQGVGGIVAMHMKDIGIDYGAVKGIMSFGSVLLAVTKFLTGFVYDRFGLRITASVSIFAAILALFFLISVRNDAVGFALAICYSVCSQFALPLETIMLPIYASDLFGKASYAKILGIFVSVNTAGYAMGAPILNLCYDLLGSYIPALIAVSVLMCATFLAMQFVITAGHREQKRVEEALQEKHA